MRLVRCVPGLGQRSFIHREFCFFRVECGWPGIGWGLWVEGEVLDVQRTSTPTVFKGIGRRLALPATALPYLIVVINSPVWRASI